MFGRVSSRQVVRPALCSSSVSRNKNHDAKEAPKLTFVIVIDLDCLYSIARATLSGVIGPVLTEIHRSSSSLPELFFFLVLDLDVTEACPLQH